MGLYANETLKETHAAQNKTAPGQQQPARNEHVVLGDHLPPHRRRHPIGLLGLLVQGVDAVDPLVHALVEILQGPLVYLDDQRVQLGLEYCALLGPLRLVLARDGLHLRLDILERPFLAVVELERHA